MKLLSRAILAAILSAASVSAAAAGTLSLELVGRGACRRADVLVTLSAGGGAVEQRTRLVAGRALVKLPIPEDSPGELVARAEARGCWAAPIEAEPATPAGHMELWPAGSVTGTVELEEGGATLPPELAVSLHRAPEGDPEAQPAEASLRCEVRGGKLEGCTVPAGRWTLRASAEGWAPVYRWDVEVLPGRGLSLGRLFLRRGGSIAGAVTAEDGLPEDLDVTVAAQPAGDAAALAAADRQRLRPLQLRTTARPSGDFALTGVPPGRYRLRAEAPPYAPASTVVDGERGRETLLESPLLLRRPVRLLVEVTPEAAPGDVAWTIDLLSEEEGHELERRDGGSTRTGRWTSSPLPPGEYWLRISGPDGTRLATRRVDLEEDLQREAVELELVIAHGKVMLGEREIAARLWFGGRTAEASIQTESLLDGGFEVMLPHGGTWKVHVVAENPAVDRQGVEVTVDSAPGGESDEVIVELPDTTLQGEVVDENGIPVSGAAVHVVRLEPFSQAALWTDETGWFEDHGLDPGAYQLQAVLEDSRSDRVQVALTDGASVPLRLVLRKTTTLRGRIVSPWGGVPGAGVMAYPLAAGAGLVATSAPRASSGPDGRFRLEVPAQAEMVRLVVLAPGYALTLRRVRLEGSQGEELEVPVRTGGGTLVIDPGDREGANFTVVYVAGEPLDLPFLRQWAGMNGGGGGEGPLPVPAMPPGEYAACRVTPQEAMAVIGGLAVPKDSVCARGDLLEGSTLELVLP